MQQQHQQIARVILLTLLLLQLLLLPLILKQMSGTNSIFYAMHFKFCIRGSTTPVPQREGERLFKETELTEIFSTGFTGANLGNCGRHIHPGHNLKLISNA